MKIRGFVGAALTVLVLSGCAQLGLSKPPGFDAEGVFLAEVTCADFLTFEEQYRESGSFHFADSITTYTEDGVTPWASGADYFASACQDAPGTTPLPDLNQTIQSVTCDSFRRLDSDVQAEWVEGWASEFAVDLGGRSLPDMVELFMQACADEGIDATIWNASYRVEDQMSILLVHEWVDREGYSYRFELSSGSTSATSSTVDSLPGEAEVSVDWDVSGKVTNLTPGRNAPYPKILILPVWAADSGACSGISSWTREPVFSTEWCTIFANPIGFFSSNELSQPIPLGGSVEATFGGTTSFAILEADQGKAVAALGSPAMWTVGLESREEFGCLLATGFWLVAATGDTGCPPA